MSTVITIVSAVLVFGFLILIHEGGHFLFARLFGVTVKEFSIGMGPRLLWYDSKKSGTRYSLAVLPIGGFVAMAGEDDESDDPNAFDKKAAWKRFLITAAGASVNILAGFLAMLILVLSVNIGTTRIYDYPESEYEVSSSASGLLPGDEVISVGGRRVRIMDELSYEIMRRGNVPVDVRVRRGEEDVTLRGVVFPTETVSGTTVGIMDFRVLAEEKTVGTVLSQTAHKSVLILRMCYEAIADLIRGRYALTTVSGPVGISGAIGEAARVGFTSLLYITGVISINLGVMNLLPIPALDGGRLLVLLIEMVSGKRLPKKTEGMINAIGLFVLLGLSAVIMVKDVIQLIL